MFLFQCNYHKVIALQAAITRLYIFSTDLISPQILRIRRRFLREARQKDVVRIFAEHKLKNKKKPVRPNCLKGVKRF